jgi:hypothetical protein
LTAAALQSRKPITVPEQRIIFTTKEHLQSAELLDIHSSCEVSKQTLSPATAISLKASDSLSVLKIALEMRHPAEKDLGSVSSR